jgi:hypothetical protein
MIVATEVTIYLRGHVASSCVNLANSSILVKLVLDSVTNLIFQ